MKYELIEHKSNNLIVFLTGWGCDSKQFNFMESNENDVLIVYDYSDLELDFDFTKYKKFYLVCFSAGVYMAGKLKNFLPKFEKTIAINGNPKPYDEYFGLSDEVKKAFREMGKKSSLNFRREFLVYSDEEYRLFNKYQCHRTMESCIVENKNLTTYDKLEGVMDFDVAILSLRDRIFNIEHQKEYFEAKSRCIYLEKSAHYPFFTLNNFDKIIEL